MQNSSNYNSILETIKQLSLSVAWEDAKKYKEMEILKQIQLVPSTENPVVFILEKLEYNQMTEKLEKQIYKVIASTAREAASSTREATK